MPVPNSMSDLSNVAGDNYPVGSEPIGNNLDNYLRSHAALIRQGNAVASSSMPSGSTVNVANANGESVLITGNSTINSLGAGFVGCKRELRFSGTPTLNHSSSLQLPGAQNISVTAGMVLRFRCIANNTWVYTGGTYTPPLDAGVIASGIFPVERGGLGVDELEEGHFLVGNGTGPVQTRTPAQVREDIGAAGLGSNEFSGDQRIRSSAIANRHLRFQNSAGEDLGVIRAGPGTGGVLVLGAGGAGGSLQLRPNGVGSSSGQTVVDANGNVTVSGSVTASGGFQFSGGPRVPRIFVQSGTPSGASDGDLWIW